MTFENCTSLTSIVIPSSITYIGSSAFDGCSSLSHITSLNPEPPTYYGGSIYYPSIGEPISTVFDGVDKTTCLLSVPVGTKDAYACADVWKEFYNIEETAGINTVSTDMQDKTVSGYYNIDGKRIGTPTKGINIVRYSDGTSKKVVR